MSTLSPPLSTSKRIKQRQSLAYFVAFIILGLVSGVLGPTLPSLAEHTRSSLSQISFLFTAQSFGYLVGSVASGHWFDRWPAHPLLIATLLLLGVELALAPFVIFLYLLLLIFFMVGITQSAIDVGGNALLVWMYGREVGPYMNALHFFFGVGALLSPIFVVQALTLSGTIVGAYAALAVLAILSTLFFRRLPSPQAPPEHSHTSQSPPRTLWVFLIAAMFFFFVGAELSFGGWIFTYMTRLHLGNAAAAGYLTSFYWASLTLGRLVSIPLSARLRPRTLMGITVGGLLLAVLLLLLGGRVTIVVWIAAFMFGAAMAPAFPSLIALAERNMPITGRTTSWFLVGGGLGAMTLPWIIGQLFEPIGPHSMIWVLTAAVIIAGAILVLFLLSASRAATAKISESAPA